jgi:hypothetical protein
MKRLSLDARKGCSNSQSTNWNSSPFRRCVINSLLPSDSIKLETTNKFIMSLNLQSLRRSLRRNALIGCRGHFEDSAFIWWVCDMSYCLQEFDDLRIGDFTRRSKCISCWSWLKTARIARWNDWKKWNVFDQNIMNRMLFVITNRIILRLRWISQCHERTHSDNVRNAIHFEWWWNIFEKNLDERFCENGRDDAKDIVWTNHEIFLILSRILPNNIINHPSIDQ